MADLVVTRAGATSVAELLALRKLNILLPLPKGASRGEQVENASYYMEKGVSQVIYDEDLTDKVIRDAVFSTFAARERYFRAMDDLNIEDGTGRVCRLIEEIAQSGRRALLPATQTGNARE
jgi:UDP-N-acetylglucosamine--N-acetylmuramyl-(pentapeptide) pyrophosphoryl-undecaprenol N-acetylglucosamine transferase